MDKAIKPTSNDIKQRQKQRLFDGVAVWAAFYRYNPHRFVKDYLNISLKLFQKILLYAMMHNNHYMYLASRGQGWLVLPCINSAKSVKSKYLINIIKNKLIIIDRIEKE